MAENRKFKKQLAVTTALAATFIAGYARQSYAACAVTTGSNYLCSGVTTGTQTITADNASITTDSTFDFDGGFVIVGKGAISFTDTYGAPLIGGGAGFAINVTGDDGATAGSLTIDLAGDVNFVGGAFAITNKGTGDVNIKAGNVSANRHNIFLNNYGGDVTIDLNSIQQEIPDAGSNWAGIELQNRGAGSLSVTVAEDVINNGIAISATNLSGFNTKNINIHVGGDVSGGSFGIVTGNYGTGTSHVYVGGSVSGNAGMGIRFRNAFTTQGDKSVIVRGDVTSASATALQALNQGNGHLLIDVGGKVQGTIGIQATSDVGGMTVNVHDVVATTGQALNLSSSGSLILTSTGDIEGGVSASSWGGLVDVTLHNSKQSAVGGGIFLSGSDLALTAVTGTLGDFVSLSASYMIKADIAKIVSDSNGVSAGLWSSGDLDLRVGDVTAAYNGVEIASFGTMDVLITGEVYAAGYYGIQAWTYNGAGGTLTVGTGASVSGDVGIHLFSYYGQDVLTLNVQGTVEGRTGNAIVVSAGYNPADPVNINIHGGRIIGDVIQRTDPNAQQYEAYCQAYPHYCSFTATKGDARVTVSGDFTSEGNFDVSSFNVAQGAVFTAGAATSITTSIDPVNVSGTFRVNAAGASVNSDLRITGGLLDIREDFTVAGAMLNSGTVSIARGKALTVDTMAAASGGTLSFGFSSTTDHGLLVVANGAADLTGQTVVVDLDPAATLNVGDQIMIIDGTGSVIGGPPADGVTVSTNSPLWEFRMVDGTGITDDSDVFLTLAKAAPPKPIDNIIAATTLTFADTAMNLTGERLSMMRHHGKTGVSAGDGTVSDDGDARIWAQALGQRVHQGMRQGVAGYGAHLLGGTVGVDTDKILDKGVLGLAFSYGESRINAQNTTHTNTNIDSYQLTFYGDYNWDNGVYVDGMGAYAFNRNKTVRHNAGGAGLDARADFDSYNVALRGEIGRVYSMGAAFVTPFALANWVYYSIDDYSETGGGGGNLNVSSKSLNQIDLGLGAKAGMTMASINGSLVVPELNVAYRRDMLNNNLSTTQTYVAGGPVYAVDGPTPARDKLTLGARVKYFDNNGFELGVSYDFDIKQDYTAHTGYVRAGVRF